jgi:hypothetical protein
MARGGGRKFGRAALVDVSSNLLHIERNLMKSTPIQATDARVSVLKVRHDSV